MKELKDRYIRFDCAIKRLLRQKANFGVLEGFLTVFLGEKITIVEIQNTRELYYLERILYGVVKAITEPSR